MTNFIAFIQIYSLLHMLLAVVYKVKKRNSSALVHIIQLIVISLIILSIVVWPEHIFRG